MMNSLLIHGVYDLETLKTLKDKGVTEFSFDLRGRSPQLVTYSVLTDLLKSLSTEKIFLTFEDDKFETIKSYLDLLKNEFTHFTLILRDANRGEYYEKLGVPFYWMFHPNGDWNSILSSENCQGVFLPLKYESEYRKHPQLWSLIEDKNLDVYLHAESFEQTVFLTNTSDVKLSVDLNSEVETSYRTVDQKKLSGLKIWSLKNESTAGQR